MNIKKKSLLIKFLSGAEIDVEVSTLNVKICDFLSWLEDENVLYKDGGYHLKEPGLGNFCSKCFLKKLCKRKIFADYFWGVLGRNGGFVDLSRTILELQSLDLISDVLHLAPRSHYCEMQYKYYLASNDSPTDDYSYIVISIYDYYTFEYILNLKLTSPANLIDNLTKYGIIQFIDIVRLNEDDKRLEYFFETSKGLIIEAVSEISFNALGIISGDKMTINLRKQS